MSTMTDETKNALMEAAEALKLARANADREKEACVAQIEADLPARAEKAAKRVATEQPEVTKSLGQDGVAYLRANLQAAAEELGRQFAASVDEIDWPLGMSYSKVENRHVHSALFNRMYKKTGALKKVLSDSGYRLGESEPFLPQYLYTESNFSAVAGALNALRIASENFEKAKKNDDNAAVNDLWGD
jgi:hypothetical protein